MKDYLILKKKRIYLLITILFFVLIYLLVPFSARRDVTNYIYQYNNISFSQGVSYHGPLYLLIIEALRGVSASVIVFLLLILSCSLYFKFKAIWRLSDLYFFSVILYGLLIFPIQELITIEAGFSIAIFLFAVRDIAERKSASYFFKIFCAISIHYSAIIFLPLYFLSSKKINKYGYLMLLLFSPLFALVSESIISMISQLSPYLPAVYAYKSANYLAGHELGTTNVFNFYYGFLYLSSIFITLISSRFNKAIDVICVKIFIIGVGIFYLFSFSPVLAYRFSAMLTTVLLILFPNMFKYFSPSSRIALAMIILTFLLINLYPTLKLYNF